MLTGHAKPMRREVATCLRREHLCVWVSLVISALSISAIYPNRIRCEYVCPVPKNDISRLAEEAREQVLHGSEGGMDTCEERWNWGRTE